MNNTLGCETHNYNVLGVRVLNKLDDSNIATVASRGRLETIGGGLLLWSIRRTSSST